nr:immunoglobulin heavy chain junction region [Macaca mulatta]MOW48169.1 immunoglobulin heavy chain junction region [Macaca mulatta]MOW48514.1 immunoglobulin heavy chain junction region [Macaca mulatta]
CTRGPGKCSDGDCSYFDYW